MYTIIIVIILLFFGYIFSLTYASKVAASRIIVPYKDGPKAPIRLLQRGRTCLAFPRPTMFGLRVGLKEKLSCLSNTVFIHE